MPWLKSNKLPKSVIYLSAVIVQRPLIYDEGLAFSEDKAAVSILGKWGFIDTKGNEFVKPQYNEVYSFHDGLAVVVKSGSYGYIDSAGSIAIPFQFSNAGNFAEGVAPTCNAKRLWGYIDRTGKEVIAFRFKYRYGIHRRRRSCFAERWLVQD